MYQLRFPKLWLLGGFFLVGLIIYGSLTTSTAPVQMSSHDKAVHLICYAIVMVWFGGILKRRNQLWVLFALFALGALLEYVQQLGGVRYFDKMDMFMNGLGLLIGKKLCRFGLSGWAQVFERKVLNSFI